TARDLALALEACVAPATAAQVSAWVEGLAHEALADRAAKLLAIERRGAAEASAPVVEVAPASVAPASAAPAGVAVTATRLEAIPRGPRTRVTYLVGALLAFLGGAAGLLALRISSAPVSVIEAAPALSVSAPVEAPARVEAPVPSSAAASSPTAPPISPASAAPPRLAPSTLAPPSRRPRPAAAPVRKEGCHTRDAAGIWHIKPECL
ncbi:MAG: hypothetical protein ABI134_04930, partial [Byssovorax sp.]